MKDFFRLVKTENRKLYSQSGVLAVLAAVLLASILLPLILRPKPPKADAYSFPDLTEQIRRYRDKGENFWACGLEVEQKNYDFFSSLGLDRSSAEFNLFSREYYEDCLFLSMLENLENGTLTREECEENGGSVYLRGELFERFFGTKTEEYDVYFLHEFFDRIPEMISLMRPVAEEWEDRIRNFDIVSYYAAEIGEVSAEMEEILPQLQIREIAHRKMPENDDARYAYELTRTEYDLYAVELEMLEAMAERKSPYCGWEYAEWERLRSVLWESVSGFYSSSYVPVTEEEFLTGEEALWEDYRNYATYVHACRDFNAPKRDAIVSVLRASVIYDIPLPGAVQRASESGVSVKGLLRAYLLILSVVCAAAVSLILCVTLAGEFSSGTVRLLLVRPNRRRRIISAKLMTAALLGLALTLLSAVLTAAVTLGIWGVGDSAVPELLEWKGGAAVLPAGWLYLAVIGSGLLLGTVFALAGAILAELTHSFFAAIVPVAGCIFAQNLQYTAHTVWIRGDYGRWLCRTPLTVLFPTAYLNSCANASFQQNLHGVHFLGGTPDFGILQLANYYEDYLSYRAHPWTGLIIMGVIALIELAAVILIFDRTQIKN